VGDSDCSDCSQETCFKSVRAMRPGLVPLGGSEHHHPFGGPAGSDDQCIRATVGIGGDGMYKHKVLACNNHEFARKSSRDLPGPHR